MINLYAQFGNSTAFKGSTKLFRMSKFGTL